MMMVSTWVRLFCKLIKLIVLAKVDHSNQINRHFGSSALTMALIGSSRVAVTTGIEDHLIGKKAPSLCLMLDLYTQFNTKRSCGSLNISLTEKSAHNIIPVT